MLPVDDDDDDDDDSDDDDEDDSPKNVPKPYQLLCASLQLTNIIAAGQGEIG